MDTTRTTAEDNPEWAEAIGKAGDRARRPRSPSVGHSSGEKR